jgi:hypothetical protein
MSLGMSRHVCGDAGGRILTTGEPCRQGTGQGRRCCWHSTTPDGRRALSMKGLVSAQLGALKRLAADAPLPTFADREAIVEWAQDMAGRVLRGELDPKLSAEARGHAQLALQARTAEAQERLVEALLRVEHGGAAMLLLTRLQDGLSDGKRRPLPGRPLALVTPEAPG